MVILLFDDEYDDVMCIILILKVEESCSHWEI